VVEATLKAAIRIPISAGPTRPRVSVPSFMIASRLLAPLRGARRGCPTSALLAAQAVERDWRQAMPRAEPALSLAPLPLSAVIGAAITTAIATTTTLRLPRGKPWG
jgi:hypothetical protein